MSLFEELFADIPDAKGENRPQSPASRPAESKQPCGLSPESPRSPTRTEEKLAPKGEAQFGNYRSRPPDAPPAEPMPRPAMDWPADLNALLRRVSVAFEWTAADVRGFRQWAQRSPDGLADACAFLEAEGAKLPAPGLLDRRAAVLDMLRADPGLRCAWSLADDGTDPLRLVIAIRDKGTAELVIPRERFDPLALPGLIALLAAQGAP